MKCSVIIDKALFFRFSENNDANNSAIAYISCSVTSASNGTYGVTYHYGNDSHGILFYNAWLTTNTSYQNKTIVHEFGHALGLAHTDSGNESISVMRATGFNLKAYPLSDDYSGISALY